MPAPVIVTPPPVRPTPVASGTVAPGTSAPGAPATPAVVAGKVNPVGIVDFEAKVLNAKGRFVVEFMDPACGHCRRMEPVLKQVAADLAKEATFFQVIVPLEPALSNALGITGWPTFLLFESGQLKKRLSAPPDVAALRQLVRNGFGR